MDDSELEELFSFSQLSTTTTLSSDSVRKPLRKDSANTFQASGGRGTDASPSVAALPSTLPIASDIEEKLLDYQKEGILWLYERHRKGRGCLLADEMGLGKTVQVSAFIGALYRNNHITSAIIIVPPTLLPVWEAALQEWGRLCSPLVEVIHNDSKVKRLQRWRRLKHGTGCLFLTTYGVLRQDSTAMGVRMVDYVVMDEVHLIKDASTQAFQSAMALSSRHRIAITGTPLMNNFEDLWSIFQFVDGSILGTTRADFRMMNTVLLRGNERDALEKERCEAGKRLVFIQSAIRPYMLRREKHQVRALSVGKRDLVVWLRLNEVQKQQYMSLINNNNCPATTGRDVQDSQPLALLTSLMLTCNHPWLNLGDGAYREAMQSPLNSPVAHENFGDVFNSSKIASALALVVKSIMEQRKTLVFSRSKRLLDLFAVALKCWWIDFFRLDGDVPSEARVNTIREFNRNERLWVCLLTTQVGGVGLTVEAASAVILLDPSWNPSTDAQAIDRVHRVGQTREVVVYRLITCGTVEEKVYRNQVFKFMAARQGTMTAVPESGSTEFHRYFTRLQLRSMFEVGDLDRSATAEQLQHLHPNSELFTYRDALMSLPYVCDINDNSCVVVEPVAENASIEESDGVVGVESHLTGTPQNRSTVKHRRQTPTGSKSSVSKIHRRELLNQEELSEILLQLEEEEAETSMDSQRSTEYQLTLHDSVMVTALSGNDDM